MVVPELTLLLLYLSYFFCDSFADCTIELGIRDEYVVELELLLDDGEGHLSFIADRTEEADEMAEEVVCCFVLCVEKDAD